MWLSERITAGRRGCDAIRPSPRQIAVALRYDPTVAPAPRVIATGRGRVAERILERARDSGVPVQEHGDLAQILSSLPTGEEIPEELFRAVAEVLALIYRVNSKKVSS